MQKIVIPLMSGVLALSLVGCAATKVVPDMAASATHDVATLSTATIDEDSQLHLEHDYIQVKNPNIGDFDFMQLQKVLADAIDAKDGKISIPFMGDQPAMKICFMPYGGISDIEMSLHALSGENGGDYIISQYTVKGNHGSTPTNESLTGQYDKRNPAIIGLNFQTAIKAQPFAKEHFNTTFRFGDFARLMQWLNTTDLLDLANTYIPNTPAWFEFTAGFEIQRELIDGDEVNCIFLDCSSDEPVQIEYTDIPYSEPGEYYFEPAFHFGEVNHTKLSYYAITAYNLTAPRENYKPTDVLIIFPDGIHEQSAFINA